METDKIAGVEIKGIAACVPATAVANGPKIAQATGIRVRRIAPAGTTVVDLCAKAAERVLADTGVKTADIGAVVFVSFTQHCRMPCGAAQVQARLGLPKDIVAFDVSLACSGWGYGLYLSGLLARQTGKEVLLLDGDVQSEFLDADDTDTAALLGDGGTATVVGPGEGTFEFAFSTDGEKGDALKLEHGGTISMDGFAVFRFVATDVVRAVREFAAGRTDLSDLTFVPHQPNVYMVRQLAKSVGIAEARTAISCDELGNLSSASVPVTIARKNVRGPILLTGFGGGLSICVGTVRLQESCALSFVEW